MSGMYGRIFCLLLAILPCLAQPPRSVVTPAPTVALPNYVSAVLSQYLSLTDSQIASFDQAIGDSLSQRASITQAISGLQTQLSKAMTASTPDPAQVGSLYLQVASQQTALANLTTQLASQLSATLSPDQQAKVKALQDALSLQPTICAAQTVGLISSTALGASTAPTMLLTGAVAFTTSCAIAYVPTANFSNGNFSRTP